MQERSIRNLYISEIKKFLNEKDIALSSLEDNLDVILIEQKCKEKCKINIENDDVFTDDEIYDYISRYQALMGN